MVYERTYRMINNGPYIFFRQFLLECSATDYFKNKARRHFLQPYYSLKKKCKVFMAFDYTYSFRF